ncbi:MAG TPA: hypothetical protein ENI05_03805 [Porticoccus sp.]|nr:hypothetical protein [Porticoccus sp.]
MKQSSINTIEEVSNHLEKINTGRSIESAAKLRDIVRIKHSEICHCVLCHPEQCELEADTITGNGVEISVATGIWQSVTGWSVAYRFLFGLRP